MTQQDQEEFNKIYYEQIGMCGCGIPNGVETLLYELINNHKEGQENKISHEKMLKQRNTIITETDSNVIFEFVFHVLNHHNLFEHGGSVYGSWFTPKGNRFLDLLKQKLTYNEE